MLINSSHSMFSPYVTYHLAISLLIYLAVLGTISVADHQAGWKIEIRTKRFVALLVAVFIFVIAF